MTRIALAFELAGMHKRARRGLAAVAVLAAMTIGSTGPTFAAPATPPGSAPKIAPAADLSRVIVAPQGELSLAVARDGKAWVAAEGNALRFDVDGQGFLRAAAAFKWPAAKGSAVWAAGALVLDGNDAPWVAAEQLDNTRDPAAPRHVLVQRLTLAARVDDAFRRGPTRWPRQASLADTAPMVALAGRGVVLGLRGVDGPDRIAALDVNGRSDSAFDGHARAALPDDFVLQGVASSPHDGGVYVYGEVGTGLRKDGLVIKLRADGKLDPAFARDGLMRFTYQTQGDKFINWMPAALVEDRQGALWVALRRSSTGSAGWWIERFDPSGKRDADWASGAVEAMPAWFATGALSGARIGLSVGGLAGGARVCVWRASMSGELRCGLLQADAKLAAPTAVLDGAALLAVAPGPDDQLTVALRADDGTLIVRRVQPN